MSTTDPKVRELTRELADWVFSKLCTGVDFDEIADALEGTLEDVWAAAAEHNDPPEIGRQVQLMGRAP